MPWKRPTHGQRQKAAVPESMRPKPVRQSTAIYGRRWRKARAAYLQKHPLCECEYCRREGRHELATVVDHIIPHKGDMTIFWDSSQWQSMAKACHDRKTAKEDGGFGNKPKHKPLASDEEIF